MRRHASELHRSPHHHRKGRTIVTLIPSLETGIHRAGATDRTAVAATVAAGFFDDPVTQWLLPDVEHRQKVIVPMFEVYVGAYLPHGETYLTADGNGAAVWLPPGAELLTDEQEQPFVDALAALMGRPGVDRLFQLEETFAEHHPAEPLFYCNFLSTVPAFQGRGIGSAFLREMLQRADADELPAYHEATSPRNRALYERHGYINLGELVLPDGGPTLWRMWRDPR
jgi:GNAT superfamily N-acetyltransferase